MSTFVAVMVGIIPSIGVGLIFWFAIRAVIRADRNERAALSREEAAAAAQSGESPVSGDDASSAAGDEARPS